MASLSRELALATWMEWVASRRTSPRYAKRAITEIMAAQSMARERRGSPNASRTQRITRSGAYELINNRILVTRFGNEVPPRQIRFPRGGRLCEILRGGPIADAVRRGQVQKT